MYIKESKAVNCKITLFCFKSTYAHLKFDTSNVMQKSWYRSMFATMLHHLSFYRDC